MRMGVLDLQTISMCFMGEPGRTSNVHMLHCAICYSPMSPVPSLLAVIIETQEANAVRTSYLYGKAIADRYLDRELLIARQKSGQKSLRRKL